MEKSYLMCLPTFSEGEDKCGEKGKPVDIICLDF